MLTIRPFDHESDADYAAAVEIDNAIWPEYPSTVEEWRHGDASRDPKYLYKRYLVEREGQIVAVGFYGHAAWAHKPGKFALNMLVHPAHQRQGIGGALYRHNQLRDNLWWTWLGGLHIAVISPTAIGEDGIATLGARGGASVQYLLGSRGQHVLYAGADLNLNTVSIVSGATVSVSSWTVTMPET